MGLVDADGDGLDDRILQIIPIPGDRITAPLLLIPELGIAYAGGLDLGVTGVTLGGPEVQLLADNANGGRRRVDRLAPFGVPTALESPASEESPPGAVRLQASVPGSLADDEGRIALELVGVGPGGLEIDGAGDPGQIPDLPRTSLRGDEAVQLTRLAANPWEEGYSVFESEPVVLLADLRASIHYDRTAEENEAGEGAVCPRCDVVEAGVYGDSAPIVTYPELLSGHGVQVRFPDSLRAALATVYDPLLLARAEMTADSVPWDVSPSVLQEPVRSASYGSGDVVGTVLHSGEMTHDAGDLHLRGRGLDLSFTRHSATRVSVPARSAPAGITVTGRACASCPAATSSSSTAPAGWSGSAGWGARTVRTNLPPAASPSCCARRPVGRCSTPAPISPASTASAA